MFRRNAHRLAACTPTLQSIISGTASVGGKIGGRGKREPGKAGDKSTEKDGRAEQEKRSDVAHVRPLQPAWFERGSGLVVGGGPRLLGRRSSGAPSRPLDNRAGQDVENKKHDRDRRDRHHFADGGSSGGPRRRRPSIGAHLHGLRASGS